MAESYDIPSVERELTSVDFPTLDQQIESLEKLYKTLPETDPQASALKGVLAFVESIRNAVVADELVPEQYVMPEEGMKIVTWPESQLLMEHPDFENECLLINDEYGLDKYGSSAYWVPASMCEATL